MKLMGICAVFLLLAGSAFAQSDQPKANVDGQSLDGQSSVEFRNAAGRVIGTVTRIGDTIYYAGPDGTPLGTSSMVDGQRVFRSY